MRLPLHLTGPQFSDGDIVSFSFNDCSLNLRLPVVSHNIDKVDYVISARDFCNIDTGLWEHHGDEGHCFIEIVAQKWVYECGLTHDDIAQCFMKIYVMKHSCAEVESLFSLNSRTFKNYSLSVLARDMGVFEQGVDIPPEKPSASNDYFVKTVAKPVLDGFQVQLNLNDANPTPSLVAFFSLGCEFTLKIEWEFGSLHYADRENPYSEELLQNMKFQLFDEFLSFIDIEYSPDTLARIETIKIE